MKTLKAYFINDGEIGHLAFHYTGRQARASFPLHDVPWINIYCKRYPQGDHLKSSDKPHMVEIRDNPRGFRELGWFNLATDINCSSCDLWEFDGVPESEVDPDTMLCKECSHE